MKPFAIGAAMAAMMIWMLHDRIMSGGLDVTSGAVAFVLAHVFVVFAFFALAFFVPAFRKLALSHRPSLGHVAAMFLGLAVTAGSIHLIMHGAPV
ncbi:MAG: hypothetical protein ABJF50_03940 [Paracoccaceae bacterium]